MTPAPPPDLMEAIKLLRSGDNSGALDAVEKGLPLAEDRAPYLALGSLAALRIGLAERAIPMLRELVASNPADAASRNNLAAALVQMGELDEALALSSGSAEPALARIEGYIRQQQGDLDLAVEAYQRAIAADSTDLASLNNLGNIFTDAGKFDEAIRAFERAITLAPADVQIYLNLADALRLAERGAPRLKVLKDAEAIAPDNIRVLIDLGMAHANVHDLDSAMNAYRKAMDLSDSVGEAHIEYGMVLEKLNLLEELSELVAPLDKDEAPPEANFLFAWEARRSGRIEEAAKFADAIPPSVLPMRRWHLVGGIADKQGDTKKAFAAFERMNQAALEHARPLRSKPYRQRVEEDIATWSRQWANAWSQPTIIDSRRDPIFLVGFPRSGTTLLDTMFMGLESLSVLEERPMIPLLARLTEGEDLSQFSGERIAALRDHYYSTAVDEGWDEGRWLVDKHPLNMQRVPLIKRLFPKAKILLAERHPYDVVLSCFMANFVMNTAMRSFTTLDEAAKTYDAVWRAWHRGIELFNVDWNTVRYENLVVNPAAELAPIVEWLGVDWDDALLNHTKTARERGHVKTASYAQIQEDLYTESRFRWRRYSDHLSPALGILKPWAEKMGYDTD